MLIATHLFYERFHVSKLFDGLMLVLELWKESLKSWTLLNHLQMWAFKIINVHFQYEAYWRELKKFDKRWVPRFQFHDWVASHSSLEQLKPHHVRFHPFVVQSGIIRQQQHHLRPSQLIFLVEGMSCVLIDVNGASHLIANKWNCA